MQFVIFHGSYGNPEGNWFPQLQESLESLDQTVFVPEFPIDDWSQVTQRGPKTLTQHQALDNWLKVYEELQSQFNPDEQLCFVGHSSGPLFILHALSKYPTQLDSAIFVSPFLDLDTKEEPWQIHQANTTFYHTDFDFNLLKQHIPTSYVIYADNDPYVPPSQPQQVAQKLHSSIISVKNGKHLNEEIGLTNFPLILELCRTRIGITPIPN